MLNKIAEPYFSALDIELQQIVNLAPVETPGFGVMLRYPMGWVDAEGNPYQGGSGKRIRPLLVLLCAAASGREWQTALPAAASVELLHNFSLIHDDIQDNSSTRHGRPTVWKVWGKRNAINAGDAIFSLSFNALSRLLERDVDAQIVIESWNILSRTALELTRGQHLDMRFEEQDSIGVDDYISMIAGKTSALISASAELGALIASENHEHAANYADFGLNLGLAFQIRDDILGIWGNADLTGKSAATDIISHKKSLPVLYGLERSVTLSSLYEKETFEESDVEQAVALLEASGALEYVQEQETKFYQRAISSLEAAQPKGEAADHLHGLIDLLFKRQY